MWFLFIDVCRGFWLSWLPWRLWLPWLVWLLWLLTLVAFVASVAFVAFGFRCFRGFWLFATSPSLEECEVRGTATRCKTVLFSSRRFLWWLLAFGGFSLLVAFDDFGFRWHFCLFVASAGFCCLLSFSCLHSLIWCKYARLFASYDSSQICLPIHLSVYIYLSISIYLSICLSIHLSNFIYVFLYLFIYLSLVAVLLSLFCFCFSMCLLCREETKQGSKQARAAHLWIWCAAGEGAAPPPTPPRHEICTSSPTPAPATKSLF